MLGVAPSRNEHNDELIANRITSYNEILYFRVFFLPSLLFRVFASKTFNRSNEVLSSVKVPSEGSRYYYLSFGVLVLAAVVLYKSLSVSVRRMLLSLNNLLKEFNS